MDKRSQLRSCPDKGLSVWTPKECKPTSVHRLSELKKLAIHIYTPLHPEHVANAFTYDNKHTLQNVLHTEKFPFTFGKSRRSLRITSQFSQQTRVVLITCHVSQSGSSKESVNTLRVLVGLLSLGLFRRPGSTGRRISSSKLPPASERARLLSGFVTATTGAWCSDIQLYLGVNKKSIFCPPRKENPSVSQDSPKDSVPSENLLPTARG